MPENTGEEKKRRRGKPTPKKTPMREREPLERIKHFFEVPYGYSPEEAVQEAQRCLMCPRPFCIDGCPVEIDIPGFIDLIVQKDFLGALLKIKETNSLPAICGRVCPQEEQCEVKCVLSKRWEPVAIGRLERFVADYVAEHKLEPEPVVPEPNGYKVAIVGSGPAGLTIAGMMVGWGYKAVIYEALHEPGGVLTYGIPDFRLPPEVTRREINDLKKLGVEVITDFIVGRTATVDQLLTEFGYDAVFLGTGAGLPRFMNIPGENLVGIYSANEFLTRVNLMKAYRFPEYDTPVLRGKRVATIGAGNVSMDSARCALRLGAEESLIVYRRSPEEMPARIEEIHHAEQEGVKFHLLTLPLEYKGDEKGWVKKMVLQKQELGEPDESGRRRPVPIKGSEYEMDVDIVVVAIGQVPTPLIHQSQPDIAITKWNTLDANYETGATTKPGVFAGGDCIRGAATVILAMGDARKAAYAMDYYIKNKTKPGIWEELRAATESYVPKREVAEESEEEPET